MLRKRYPQIKYDDFKDSLCPNGYNYHSNLSNMPAFNKYDRFQQLLTSVTPPPQPTVKTAQGIIFSASNINTSNYASVKTNKNVLETNKSEVEKTKYATAFENKIDQQITKKIYRSGKSGRKTQQKSNRSYRNKSSVQERQYQRYLDNLQKKVIDIAANQDKVKRTAWSFIDRQQGKIVEPNVQEIFDCRIKSAKDIHYKKIIDQLEGLAQKITDLKLEVIKYKMIQPDRQCEQYSRAQTIEKQFFVEGRNTRVIMQVDDQQNFRTPGRIDHTSRSKYQRKPGISIAYQQRSKSSIKKVQRQHQSQEKLKRLRQKHANGQYISLNDNRCLGLQVFDQGQILFESK